MLSARTVAGAALLLVACGGSGTTNDWAHMGSSSGTSSSGGSSGGGSGGGSSSGVSPGGPLDPSVAPGGNFDLSIWELELPANNTTISSSRLQGPNGYHDSYFFTDPTDGSMTFWDPENGQTTPNSSYPRTELKEVSGGATANWPVTGTHTMSATLKSSEIPDHVCVGQVHVGSGTPHTTKPLFELFYYSNGDLEMAIESGPTGTEAMNPAGNVPLGTKWSYEVGLSGGKTITLVVNGGAMHSWPLPSGFDMENMYFKAGDYDQSAGSSSTVGAKVQFYALSVLHMP